MAMSWSSLLVCTK